tara:strand:+ start:11175 stop:11777 length:603 start_codon:yes stop_codon:yes gene_type:complete
MSYRKIKNTIIAFSLLSLTGCAMLGGESKTTSHKNNACKMLKQNPDWLEASLDSYKKWKTPISIQLAFIRQESSFRHDARPIRKNKWYEFGTNYASTAYGYSQALEGTWEHYLNSTNQSFKRRDSYADAVDFIGWYNKQTTRKNKINRTDAYDLYLAYHEGWGGYQKKSYQKKPFLKKAARNVEQWSVKYSKQLNNCRIK